MTLQTQHLTDPGFCNHLDSALARTRALAHVTTLGSRSLLRHLISLCLSYALMNITSRFLAFVLFCKGPCVCVLRLYHCPVAYTDFTPHSTDQCFSVQLTSCDIAILRTAAERRKVTVRVSWC